MGNSNNEVIVVVAPSTGGDTDANIVPGACRRQISHAIREQPGVVRLTLTSVSSQVVAWLGHATRLEPVHLFVLRYVEEGSTMTADRHLVVGFNNVGTPEEGSVTMNRVGHRGQSKRDGCNYNGAELHGS